jgi:hypothetical protein
LSSDDGMQPLVDTRIGKHVQTIRIMTLKVRKRHSRR